MPHRFISVNNLEITASLILGWGIAAVVYLIGGVDKLIEAFALFMVLDYASGMLSAWLHKTWSSSIGRRGAFKKAGFILAVIVAHWLDVISNTDNNYMRSALLLILIGTEGVSILENLSKLGVPVPAFLKNALMKLRGSDTGERRRKNDRRP